jgi:hypothetical protein
MMGIHAQQNKGKKDEAKNGEKSQQVQEQD